MKSILSWRDDQVEKLTLNDCWLVPNVKAFDQKFPCISIRILGLFITRGAKISMQGT